MSGTTAGTLAVRENMSFASLSAKWLGPGSTAYVLAVGSSPAGEPRPAAHGIARVTRG